MTKLFIAIDADEFMRMTQALEMDGGLTSAFIRGFNFCASGQPQPEASVNRERTEYRPPAMVSWEDLHCAVNDASGLTTPEVVTPSTKQHYENIATQLNKRLQSA